MFSGYWRHMGWGEPAALNNVVHYVYAQHGTGSDAGDIYYIRSTDGGVTFSAPLKLNTDSGTAKQWQPNLSVSPIGTVFATWYDTRNGGACSPGANTPCYQMFGRESTDNGVTWQADMPFSDVVSPLPAQPDPGIVSCYVGDYDYGSAQAAAHYSSWVDGRVAINGTQQQDAFTDHQTVVVGTPTPTATASPSPTATATASPTPTATATATATPTSPPSCNGDIVVNPGFETGSFPPWVISGDTSFTFVNTVMPHTGTYSEQSGPTSSDGFTDQILPTVAGQAYNVSFWLANQDTTSNNRFGATFGSVTLVPEAVQSAFGYTQYTFTNVVPGANADLHFIFFNPPSYFYLDDVCVTPSGGGSPTPTSTPTASPTCAASWSAGPNMPTVLVRAVGVYFPDGNFYTMGGRTSDLAGSDFQHVLKYSPGTNTWTQMPSTLPDNQMNNMACGVLTLGGTPYIYCVGGSAATQTTATARVFYYDPATDTVTHSPVQITGPAMPQARFYRVVLRRLATRCTSWVGSTST